MKHIFSLIMFTYLILSVLRVKITTTPFSISWEPQWLYLIGTLLVIIGFICLAIHWQHQGEIIGFKKGVNDLSDSIIKDLQKLNK